MWIDFNYIRSINNPVVRRGKNRHAIFHGIFSRYLLTMETPQPLKYSCDSVIDQFLSSLLKPGIWTHTYNKMCRNSGSRFIHLAVCLTTGKKPLPKRALHLVQSRASSFKWEYHLLSLGNRLKTRCDSITNQRHYIRLIIPAHTSGASKIAFSFWINLCLGNNLKNKWFIWNVRSSCRVLEPVNSLQRIYWCVPSWNILILIGSIIHPALLHNAVKTNSSTQDAMT